jgi:HK97 family phage portal protein
MGILRRLFGSRQPLAAVEQKSSPVFAEIGRSASAGTRNTADRYWQYSAEGYELCPIVRQCVSLKATNVTAFAWRLLTPDGEEVTDHPILELLRRPNVTQTEIEFWEQVLLFLDCGGGAPLHASGANMRHEPVGPGAAASRPGLVSELYTYRPDQVEIFTGRTGVPAKYEWSGGGQRVTFPVDPITGNSVIRIMRHANARGGDPYRYGTPPIQTAAMNIDMYNEATRWNKNLLLNKAQPPGYWGPTDGNAYTVDQVRQINQMIAEEFAGSDNAGHTPFVGSMEWHSTGLGPEDMSFRDTVEHASREIAKSFGVPSLMLGIPGDNTYSNYEKALEAFWTQTMLPLGQRLLDTLNAWLVPMWDPSMRLDIDRDQIVALEPVRAAKWDQVKSADFMTINEKREAVGLPPIDTPEADELMVPANVLPLGMDTAGIEELQDGLRAAGYTEGNVQAFAAKLAMLDPQAKAVGCTHSRGGGVT